MTAVEAPNGSVVIIRGCGEAEAEEAPDTAGTPAEDQWADYLETRERDERAAAREATSLAARHAHHELAQCYALQLAKIRSGA